MGLESLLAAAGQATPTGLPSSEQEPRGRLAHRRRLAHGMEPPRNSMLHQLTIMSRHNGDADDDDWDRISPLDLSSMATPAQVSPILSADSDGNSLSSGSPRSQSAPPSLDSQDCTLPDTPSSSSTTSNALIPAQILPSHCVIPVPTEGQLNRSFVSAQAKYPGKACIFVGNLPAADFDDVEMTLLVGTEFSVFGDCFVRVERVIKQDGVQMPHAYVQFTNVKDAKLALINGSKINVNGRQFRTEPSRAKRSVIVGRRGGGGPIMLSEACAAMRRFGEIEGAVSIHHYDGFMHQRLAKVTFVTFGGYAKARGMIASYRDPAYMYFV